jgi:hypothetical protein
MSNRTLRLTLAALAGVALAAPSVAAQMRVPPAVKPAAIPVSGPSAHDMARNANTYAEDVALTNQCVRDGGGKAVCVCVTKVMKYELPLTEYRALVSGYAQPAPVSRYGARLQRASHRAAPVPAEVQHLTASRDFGTRCQQAHGYFFPAPRS